MATTLKRKLGDVISTDETIVNDDDNAGTATAPAIKKLKTLDGSGTVTQSDSTDSAGSNSATTAGSDQATPIIQSFTAADILGSEEQPARAPPKPYRKRKQQTLLPLAPGQSSSGYGGFAERYMADRGFQSGQGLGARGDGMAHPLATSGTMTRTGLGHESGIQQVSHEYVPEKVIIEIKPDVCPDLGLEWRDNESPKSLNRRKMDSWFTRKRRVDRMGVEWINTFCSVELQKKMMEAKTFFDIEGNSARFRTARNKANPFEMIGTGGMYQNRAALKMCEIDKLVDYGITEPSNCYSFQKDRNAKRGRIWKQWQKNEVQTLSLIEPVMILHDLVFFADICAGPGGFTEYFTHVHKWKCRGWGFTLKAENDFNFLKFNACSPFDTFTAEYGEDGTGDITRTANLKHFRRKVLNATQDGVHVVMADGGFNVTHDYNAQEILSKQLILCQFACAIGILKRGGNFVCKLFDTFQPFTASLLYLLESVFESIALIKPNQSRPANSERYVFAKGFKLSNKMQTVRMALGQTELVLSEHDLLEHLYRVNDEMSELKERARGMDRRMSSSPGPVDAADFGTTFISATSGSTFGSGSNLLSGASSSSSSLTGFGGSSYESSSLQEVAPLVPIEQMDARFVKWLRSFNEEFMERQIRFLVRTRHYFEDPLLKVDDQHAISDDALDYWFTDREGQLRLKRDINFGHTYVTRVRLDPNETLHRLLCSEDTVYGKQVYDRIHAQFDRCTDDISHESFNPQSEFMRYKLRGDWWVLSFELTKPHPQYVLLVQSENGLYEVENRQTQAHGVDYPFYAAKRVTMHNIRFPRDTIVDCIKVHDPIARRLVYRVIDAWVIGSTPVWRKHYSERVQFCRMLVSTFGSDIVRLNCGKPVIQALTDPEWIAQSKRLVLFFIRAKHGPESERDPASCVYRPSPLKIWVGNDKEYPDYNIMLETFKAFERRQIEAAKNPRQ